ncbi:conserved Plasmodium protein, unknown function [Plasmodium ovale wallikeri]|uniref:EF-hand domain-containing protein n=2 Tax=Plasmodium ovale TaxID=36330 RepID=A0A1A8ZZD9_PLAOA|nr:conserved Plasmodium protein, unknown function [Plasmodium ovale wallikeri]SBT49579.1 conserved Plasmodium protein, unknown function [Plasmodium ovale wallikeri]SBT82601.1 conserved Plasmodium protein, unknown function [Plasmodium ovale]
MEMDVQYLIRALKYFTKTDDGELCEKDVHIIFNKILSQNVSHESVRELIKSVKAVIPSIKSNYVENFILTPSILHILIKRQLKKHDLRTIFKDLFSCIETNGEIDTNSLKKFLHLCNNSGSDDSSMSLSNFSFRTSNSSERIDFATFVNLMQEYLKKA